MIKLIRQAAAAVLILIPMTSVWASPQAVEVIAGAPPGGAIDVTARHVATYLEKNLKRPFIVVNRPGAEGRISINYFANQDTKNPGLYLLATGSFMTLALSPEYGDSWFANHDIIAPIVRTPGVVAVGNKSGLSTFKDLVEAARTRPVNCGTSNPASDLMARFIKQKLSLTQLNIVPYKGSGPLNIDVIGGHIDCTFDAYAGVKAQHEGDRLRIIATFGSDPLKDVPTAAVISAWIPNFSFYNWYGIAMSKNSDPAFRSQVRAQLESPGQDLAIMPGLETVKGPLPDFIKAQTQWFRQFNQELNK